MAGRENEVLLYKDNHLLMKVEKGTRFGVVKLLYGANPNNNGAVVGLRPRIPDDYPCLVTLDSTVLEQPEYDLIIYDEPVSADLSSLFILVRKEKVSVAVNTEETHNGTARKTQTQKSKSLDSLFESLTERCSQVTSPVQSYRQPSSSSRRKSGIVRRVPPIISSDISEEDMMCSDSADILPTSSGQENQNEENMDTSKYSDCSSGKTQTIENVESFHQPLSQYRPIHIRTDDVHSPEELLSPGGPQSPSDLQSPRIQNREGDRLEEDTVEKDSFEDSQMELEHVCKTQSRAPVCHNPKEQFTDSVTSHSRLSPQASDVNDIQLVSSFSLTDNSTVRATPQGNNSLLIVARHADYTNPFANSLDPSLSATTSTDPSLSSSPQGLRHLPEERSTMTSISPSNLPTMVQNALATNGKQIVDVDGQARSCPLCSRVFLSQNELEEHVLAHSGIMGRIPQKLETCRICHKVFRCASHLEKHLRCHTGEKPFECKVCGRCFTYNSNMKQHMLTHQKIKPFKCDHCGRTFARSNVLKAHKRLHTGEMPLKCPICKSTFLHMVSLRRHLIVNHPETKESLDRTVARASVEEMKQTSSMPQENLSSGLDMLTSQSASHMFDKTVPAPIQEVTSSFKMNMDGQL